MSNCKDKEEFDKWRLEYISTHTGYFKMIGTDDLSQVTWQAACEYKQKEIDELEAKSSVLTEALEKILSHRLYIPAWKELEKYRGEV